MHSQPCTPSSALQPFNNSHLLPYDFGSVSSWSPYLPCSPKAKSPPTPVLPRQKDQPTSQPLSQPSVCVEILPGGQVEVISSQDRFPLPGVTSLNLTVKVHLVSMKPGPAEWRSNLTLPGPLLQARSLRLLSRDPALSSVYGVSLDFFPHSFPDCRPSSLSPATLPYMTKFTIPSHHCISGTNSMSRINICHMEPESERRHSITPAEKEPWTISFQNNWGIQNSAPDLPGPEFQQCSIPLRPCTLRSLGSLI